GRLLRIASRAGDFSASLETAPSRRRARCRISCSDTIALRGPGFHGVGHARVHVPADGWLNRALRGADHSGSGLRAIALGPSLPRILAGSAPVLALNNLSNVGVEGKNSAPLADRFEAMHDSVLHGTQREAFEAVKMLRS